MISGQKSPRSPPKGHNRSGSGAPGPPGGAPRRSLSGAPLRVARFETRPPIPSRRHSPSATVFCAPRPPNPARDSGTRTFTGGGRPPSPVTRWRVTRWRTGTLRRLRLRLRLSPRNAHHYRRRAIRIRPLSRRVAGQEDHGIPSSPQLNHAMILLQCQLHQWRIWRLDLSHLSCVPLHLSYQTLELLFSLRGWRRHFL